MAKKIDNILKLQLQAGQASPAPPVGPALGQAGVNIMQFVKEYNERTKELVGNIIPVELTVYADRSFDMLLKTPPASDLIKKAAGVESASGSPGLEIIGKITQRQVKEIAETKMSDLNASDIDAAIKIISGSAKSMGIEIE
ncbi:MAG: 50S ribosomal protein L11 [Chloroflexi bacterium]|nr:50S ribosomal protein L11 [Chloroflexota bacterium]MCL0030776.1 50S ribosomal protein L11 [Dehalococcoidia bacterium]MDP6425610.1 50S ribosomal protein L11 [Dehalococcoidia bacterium]MDP7232180.1 50S ribosomal protein L11 [Dehalococcoidia bacterium]